MSDAFMTGLTGLEILSVVDEGLGHSGHVVAIDGQALVIDPLRSVDAYLAVIDRRGWRLRWTADTHLHADYVSGGPELAARGAAFFAPGEAALEIPHRPLEGGDEVDMAGLTLQALPTPGHTPDHLCYLLLDAGRPLVLFSGGSLMVGTVGRPDLFGPEHTEELARAMYRSLRDQLLVLPDELAVYPTHKILERTSMNSWDDQNVRDALAATGRKKIVVSGLWTEVCNLMFALSAIKDAQYEIYMVADASGGTSVDAHKYAMDRMVQAGVIPVTWQQVLLEWQRDWARKKTYDATIALVQEHSGAYGMGVDYAYTLVHEAAERVKHGERIGPNPAK